MFCRNCGAEISNLAVVCVKCGVPNTPLAEIGRSEKSRVAYVLLGIFLGWLGIHNFYIGRTQPAVAQLLIGLLLGWFIFPAVAVFIWAIVDVCTIDKDAKGQKLS